MIYVYAIKLWYNFSDFEINNWILTFNREYMVICKYSLNCCKYIYY